MSWTSINASYPQILRGILQQTTEGLLYAAPTYTSPGAPRDPADGEVFRLTGLSLRRFKLQNRSASTVNVGIGFRWANRFWKAGQITAALTPDFIDDTTDAQDGPVATPDFALMTTTAADGWAVHADRPFSWVSVRIETASVGAASTVTASYSNFAGTGWTAMTEASQTLEPSGNTLLIIDGENYGDAEERMIVFAPPNDWGKVVGDLDGVPTGRYAMRFLNDVSTTAGVASVVEVGSMVATESLATLLEYSDDTGAVYSDPYADAVVAFFSVADAGNRVRAEVTTGI